MTNNGGMGGMVADTSQDPYVSFHTEWYHNDFSVGLVPVDCDPDASQHDGCQDPQHNLWEFNRACSGSPDVPDYDKL